jgi:hypothetical protein
MELTAVGSRCGGTQANQIVVALVLEVAEFTVKLAVDGAGEATNGNWVILVLGKAVGGV